MDRIDEREEEKRRPKKSVRRQEPLDGSRQGEGPARGAVGKGTKRERRDVHSEISDTGEDRAARRGVGRTPPGAGTGLPPDPWSETHPPSETLPDQRGENGGIWGRGPLRILYEQRFMPPSFLPPEKGRSAEAGYHGRAGYEGRPASEGKHMVAPARRWLLPGIAILVVAAAYLLSRALVG